MTVREGQEWTEHSRQAGRAGCFRKRQGWGQNHLRGRMRYDSNAIDEENYE